MKKLIDNILFEQPVIMSAIKSSHTLFVETPISWTKLIDKYISMLN
jgi:hypothetical protein